MNATKQAIWYNTLKQGLASANQGNPFWTQSQAMSALNAHRNLNRGTAK